MTGRKGIKESQTKGTAPAAGGFSLFQLLIFLVATSSMAMNFAMLYGLIPIKGKFLTELSGTQSNSNLSEFYDLT